MNFFFKIDTWIVDHLAQPIVNWAADYGIVRHRLAQIFYMLSILPGSFPLLHIKLNYYDVFFIETIILFGALFYCNIAEKEGNTDANVWIRPRSFFVQWPTRLNWTVWTFVELVQLLYYGFLWSLLILCGCYILAARPRPPARRKQKTPYGELVGKRGF